MSLRTLGRFVPAYFLLAFLSPAHCDVTDLHGEYLTIASKNVSVSFKGAEVVRITNQITGEFYFNNVVKLPPMLEMPMVTGEKGPLKCTTWRLGRANDEGKYLSAQTTFTDLDRTVWINASVDEQTQDIAVRIWGDSRRDGVSGLTWGIRGIDLSYGKLIIPAQGGIYLDKQTAPQSTTLRYPTDWEAQMMVWEAKQGGFVVYCRDPEARYRKLRLQRRGDYADLAIETEAVAPWVKANTVPQSEWRINAFKGDWRVPATGYRALMSFNRTPLESSGGRSWVKDIRSVVTIQGSSGTSDILNAVAKKLNPKKTLLYFPAWRKAGADGNYPDYTPSDDAKTFIEQAHDLGFRVMLHTQLAAVSPNNPEFARLGKFQAMDPVTGSLAGNRWDHADSDAQRYAFINPASSAYRDAFIRQLKPVIQELKPDAIHLACAGPLWNDGKGLIDDQNFIQGAGALQRALLDAAPDLVLSVECLNEVFAPTVFFAQRRDTGGLAAHPISAFLFGDRIQAYGHVNQPNPDRYSAQFLKSFSRYEVQGVLPTLPVSSAVDLSDEKPEMARLVRVAKSWQDHDLVPYWNGDPGNALLRLVGADGTTASVEQIGTGVRFKVGDDVLYHRIRGTSEVATSLFLPGWTAYDEGSLFGLDPAKDYWLEPAPRPAASIHLTAIPIGAVLADAAISADSCRFELRYVERPAASLLKLYPNTHTGLILEGRDTSISHGGKSDIADVMVGGESRTSVQITPPFQGLLAGETYVEYDIQVPSNRPILSFSFGLPEGTPGSAEITCRVSVDKKELWRKQATADKWQNQRIDLSAYAGESVKLRLISGLSAKVATEAISGVWSEVQILAGREIPASVVKIQLPKNSNAEITTSSGHADPPKDNIAVLSDVSLPATITVRLKPATLANNK